MMENEKLISNALHKTFKLPPILRGGGDTIPLINKAMLQGLAIEDLSQKGIAIYSDPKNLATALTSILSHLQNQANFHPAKQDPKTSGHFYPLFQQVVHEFPVFGQPLSWEFEKSFNGTDYNELLNQAVSIFSGLSIDAINQLKFSIADMGRTVFGTKEPMTNLLKYHLLIINTQNVSKPGLFMYQAKFSMTHDKANKKEVHSQRYTIQKQYFPIHANMIKDYASAFASVDQKSISDWMQDANSRVNHRARLCYTVQPITPQQLAHYRGETATM